MSKRKKPSSKAEWTRRATIPKMLCEGGAGIRNSLPRYLSVRGLHFLNAEPMGRDWASFLPNSPRNMTSKPKAPYTISRCPPDWSASPILVILIDIDPDVA